MTVSWGFRDMHIVGLGSIRFGAHFLYLCCGHMYLIFKQAFEEMK